MYLNWYALAVSILGNCIPETAFERLQSDHPDQVKNQITDDDLDDIASLHEQGVYYKDLAEMYGMETTNLHKRLKKAGKLVKAMPRRRGAVPC